MLLSLSYFTPEGSFELGGRYAFSENAALVVNYLSQTINPITISDLNVAGRYKLNLGEQLAIVAEAGLIMETITISGLGSTTGTFTTITAQAEYKTSDMFTINGGVIMLNGEGLPSSTTFRVGAELKPIKQLTVGLDYNIPSSGGNGIILLDVTYSL